MPDEHLFGRPSPEEESPVTFVVRATSDTLAALRQLDAAGSNQPADGRVSRDELAQAIQTDPTLLNGLDTATRQTIAQFIASNDAYLQIVMDSPNVNTSLASRHDGPAAAVAFPSPNPHACQPGDPPRQAQLRRQFLDGGYVYSQNFGIMDHDHIGFWAAAYIQVYLAAQEAQRTGQPQTIALHPGSGMTAQNLHYTIDPASAGEDLFALARGICADASYRYEESTNYGVINDIAQFAGRGTSAFSTEDLSSNAVGMRAAEEQIRSLITDPEAPHHLNPASLTQLRDMVPSLSGRSYLATESAAHTIYDWVLRHAGTLSSEATARPHGVERTTFGNWHFPPRTVPGLGIPEPAESSYFQLLEAETAARGGHMSGHGQGWHLQE